MVAVPGVPAVTRPLLSIVATFSLLETQVMMAEAVPLGTLGLSSVVMPVERRTEVRFKLRLVGAFLTVM